MTREMVGSLQAGFGHFEKSVRYSDDWPGSQWVRSRLEL